VFTPLAFLKGTTGRLFREFGIAVAAAVSISGFVALTLTPMLCAKILRVPHRQSKLAATLEHAIRGVTTRYERALGAALRHRVIVLAGVSALVALAIATFLNLSASLSHPRTA